MVRELTVAEYQDITGIKIAQAAMTTAYVVIYTSPTDTRTYVKDIMITGNKLPTVNVNKNIYDATKVIDKKKLGIVIVMEKKQIKGIITDDDTRRRIKYLYLKQN